MNDIFKIIIGFVLGLVGSLFGVVFSHIASERRERLKEFNQAAAEFRSAFIPELRYIDYRYTPERGSRSKIHGTLASAFDKHEIAVIKFRPFLNRAERFGLDKTWDDYCDRENGIPHFMNYAELEGLNEMIQTKRIYLAKLKSLLTFANPKHFIHPFT